MAKLFEKATWRPVGCPVLVQFPNSSSTVFNRPISMTSPPTPSISTQSPTRIPFLPISANQPKKETMKSFNARVRPAVVSPMMVESWLGRPKDDQKNQRERHHLDAKRGHDPHLIEPLLVG